MRPGVRAPSRQDGYGAGAITSTAACLWIRSVRNGLLWITVPDCRWLRVWGGEDCGEDGGGVGEVGEHGVGAGLGEPGGGRAASGYRHRAGAGLQRGGHIQRRVADQ